MKVSSKTLVFVVALSSLLVVGAYLSWSKAKASTTKATAAPVQYHFTNNGTVFGTDPSPIQIVQVSHNGTPVPVGSPIAGDVNLLDGVEVTLRNVSPQDIKFARLRLDVIDPQTNRIAITAAGLAFNTRLAPGQEQSGKALASTVESLRQSASDAGLTFQKVLVQVDIVEMTNDMSWKYGLLHRQDSQDSTTWRPIALFKQQSSFNRQSRAGGNGIIVEKASMTLMPSAQSCEVFRGYSRSPNGCPYCTVYNEIWEEPGMNEQGYGIPGTIIYHCPDGRTCTKIGYTGWCEG
ncbi:MAG: hypothetical protein JMDDDDMK_00681 [Acidobacteria bacterium]|nr:hypothetical protein [Acidobacteriota bacterium]